MSNDPAVPPPPPDATGEQLSPGSPDAPQEQQPTDSPDRANGPDFPDQPDSPDQPDAETAAPRRRILIGSQRDPVAYRPKPKRDWVSFRTQDPKKGGKGAAEGGAVPKQMRPGEPTPSAETVPPRGVPPKPATPSLPGPLAERAPSGDATPVVAASLEPGLPADLSARPSVTPPVQATPAALVQPMVAALAQPTSAAPVQATVAASFQPLAPPLAAQAPPPSAVDVPTEGGREPQPEGRDSRRGPRRGRSPKKPARRTVDLGEPVPPRSFPRPSIRDRLSPELEAEFQAALADVPIEDLMISNDTLTSLPALEPESRHVGRVIAVRRDDVFVALGGREQGILSLRLFQEPPQPEATFEVIVARFNSEDGLYELNLPNVAASVGDWSEVFEGMLVEAHVTGHNTGGLECEVSRLRGFIPISQVSLYRVESLEEYVDQRLTCLVTEADPARKNLVLSRRAVLEREQEEARKTLLESLAPGQIREGVVRKLMDFGAFVDLGGGVDGLIHVSQLGWGRVRHPGEVLQEGQRVMVRIDKVNPDSGRISLGYRELVEENPWTRADGKYLPNSPQRGRVVKIMEFGAFVELEPGVEGLVHISELSHRRVARVTDVVKEGDEIDVMVLSVESANRRISLSMKNLLAPPEPEPPPPGAKGARAEPAPPAKPRKQPPARPLTGGLGRSPSGKPFGLKW